MTSIRGYENYVIFEDGVVINTETGKEMKPWLNKTNGYYKVSLSKNNKQRTNYNHRLIALAYIPNPDNKDFIELKIYAGLLIQKICKIKASIKQTQVELQMYIMIKNTINGIIKKQKMGSNIVLPITIRQKKR